MANVIKEGFRTLYVDPGEDTGWCQAVGSTLIGAGTNKMHDFSREAHDAVMDSHGERPIWSQEPMLNMPGPWLQDDAIVPSLALPIKRLVVEDWRLYPKELKSLAWDQCRTARLIGKLELIADMVDIEFVLQGANIKPRAVAGGAEEFYYHPLHENRHQNDAIQHYVFYTQTTLIGKPRLDILDKNKTLAHHPV